MCNCEVLGLYLTHSRGTLEDYKEGFSKAQSGGSVKNGMERDKAKERKTKLGQN